jgi:hypothetical protein
MFTLALFHPYDLALLTMLILEHEEMNFNDLGKLMLGGFVLAVAVAVSITFIRLKRREKRPAAQFISISPLQKKD